MLPLEPFLTAYDPSDLPGASVDPLGFDRAYNFLVDKLLPGLTNAAGRPRYFSLLCAGVLMAEEHGEEGGTERGRQDGRLQSILRLERLWALANVLAVKRDTGESLEPQGLRGVRFAQARARYLEQTGRTELDADFRLLTRQQAYGAVGIYGTVADNLRLIDRDTLEVTADLGDRLGRAFLEESKVPNVVRDASLGKGVVNLNTLKRWGERAHISASLGVREGECLQEALLLHPTRQRMARLLASHPLLPEEDEQTRLGRIAATLDQTGEDSDLWEGLRVILSFEDCFRLAMLGFLRLLWACQSRQPFEVREAEMREDRVLGGIVKSLPTAVLQLTARVERSTTEAFLENIVRLAEAKEFLVSAAKARDSVELARVLVDRHTGVQRAKSQGGRPKMPWLEWVDDRITPTVGRALQVGREPVEAQDVVPHAYRTASADALQAGGNPG